MLREGIEVKDVLLLGNQVLQLELWSDSNIVGGVNWVIWIRWRNGNNVILVLVLCEIEHGEVIWHYIEKHAVENHISKANYRSLFKSSPPWSETIEWLLVFLNEVVVVWDTISDRYSSVQLKIVTQDIEWFEWKLIGSSCCTIDTNGNCSVESEITCCVEDNWLNSIGLDWLIVTCV